MADGQHPCANPSCTAPAKAGQLMCWPCWKALPREIRNKVNRTWRNVRRDSGAYRDARDEAVRWHAERASQEGLF